MKERERERDVGGVWWRESVALSLKITASALKFAGPCTLHFFVAAPPSSLRALALTMKRALLFHLRALAVEIMGNIK